MVRVNPEEIAVVFARRGIVLDEMHILTEGDDGGHLILKPWPL